MVFGLSAALLMPGCSLPRSGPRRSEIFAGAVEQGGNAFVVSVDARVARLAAQQPALGFGSDFTGTGVMGSDTISAGDTLTLTIWENVEQGVMSQKGTPTQLTEVQVDGNRTPKLFKPLPVSAIVKGDAKVAEISAASILAKTARDAELVALDAQYPVYGFARHKGYPTAEHLAAIAEHGVLSIHRKTFGPVKAWLATHQGELF